VDILFFNVGLNGFPNVPSQILQKACFQPPGSTDVSVRGESTRQEAVSPVAFFLVFIWGCSVSP
ncbi:hypothetical protein CPC197_1309, partial [Chlamydia psittaci C1/97]